MKLLRWFLIFLAVFAGLLAVVVFDPWAQTALAQAWLNRQPGLRATLGTVMVKWSGVEVKDLRLRTGDSILVVPVLTVALPIKEAILERQLRITGLVAKGWTLDLASPATPAGPVPKPPTFAAEPESTGAFYAQQVLQRLHGILSEWRFPADLTLDGISLEGDLRLPAPKDETPVWRHVVATGGGLAAGREGDVTLTASELNSRAETTPQRATLRLALTMDTPRTIERIRVEGRGSGAPQGNGGRRIALDATVSRVTGAETYSLAVTHDGRPIATAMARLPEPAGAVAGTWKVDTRDGELAGWPLSAVFAGVTAQGDGTFVADRAFAQIRWEGELTATVPNPERVHAGLSGWRTLELAARFVLTQRARAVRIATLTGWLIGDQSRADVSLRQPVEFDERTRRWSVADPAADWLEVSLQGIPLSAGLRLPESWRISGGIVTGGLVLRGSGETIEARTLAPLIASNVTVQQSGREWGRELDLSMGLKATIGGAAWELQWQSLVVASRGTTIATSEGRVKSGTGAKGRTTVTGTWQLDLDALAAQPMSSDLGRLPGRSAQGDFTARLGSWNDVTGRITVVGHRPDRTFSATVSADVDASGRVSFLVPATIRFGRESSDVTAEGAWTRAAAPAFSVKLTGGKVEWEHLRPMARPLAWLAGGATLPTSVPGVLLEPAPGRARVVPLWGDVSGRASVAVERFRVLGRELRDVGGTVTLEPRLLRLEGGHGQQEPYHPAKLAGTIAFETAAALPYRLEATASLTGLTTAELLPTRSETTTPVWEGKYAAAVKSTSAGQTFDELWRRREDEFRLTSEAGIVRVLATEIASSIPKREAKSNETLGRIGESLGDLFKQRRNEDKIVVIPSAISLEAEQVMNVSYVLREFAYSTLAITAFRTVDGTIHLNEIAIEADSLRLRGTGQIGGPGGARLMERPLRLDLRLGLHQGVADGVIRSGLLSGETDAQGYLRLAEPVRLGGTLEAIDDTEWREQLLRAARR